MSNTQVYIDGSVYSPVDPYATALVAKDGDVVWVGSDAGAESIRDDSMETIQLDGDLLTPSFIHGYQHVESAEEADQVLELLENKGFSTAILSTQNTELPSQVEANIRVKWLVEIGGVTSLPAGFTGINWTNSNISAEEFNDLLQSEAEILSFSTDVSKELVNLRSEITGYVRPAIRIENFTDFSNIDLLEKMAKFQINIGINISKVNEKFEFSVLSETAVPYYLVADAQQSSELIGWETVRYAIENFGMSARSAFNSLTKGVARALGGSAFLGQLVPDAPAAMSRWQVEELMVQTADSRVANWSTDPRARIPLLPVLEAGNEPKLVRNYPAQ